MGISSNSAFEGCHRMPSGQAFEVRYCSAAYLAPLQRWPRGHHAYKRAGWYWWPLDNSGDLAGPFTSSRKAYLAARECLALCA